MLQLRNICKKYVTGTLVQTALDDISLTLRDSEFVAVLGPSGSGKTTLLNVIGGLDRYDSGDLIVSGVSTKRYRDRDWDSYRNHTIGFVFQSYNLIPHQTVLANVELALTISGIGRTERRRRAREALEKVGLGDQLHKKPNQMSGGQMQRVAIARALVNNPDVLLADEPTGALDSETSIQVLELLREVAKDRLVVMVTHNAELAEIYASRIVRLRDGKVTDDTDPYPADTPPAPPVHRNMGRSSMSFITSLALSFNNLKTKKARTILTAFAGSIGIIGIALILAISTGVNSYIVDLQKSTMASYPITIQKQSVDLTSLLQERRTQSADSDSSAPDHGLDAVYSDGSSLERASRLATNIAVNNLADFKAYLDDPDSEIAEYIGDNGILYSYDTRFGVYTYDPDGTFVNTDGSTLQESGNTLAGTSFGMGALSAMGQGSSANSNFSEIMVGRDGSSISQVVTDSYEVVYGSWPAAYDEVVLVLDANNEISAKSLYELGVLPSAEYGKLMDRIDSGEEITLDTRSFSYEQLCGLDLRMIPACDTYLRAENGNFTSVAGDTAQVEELMKTAVRLKISGIVRLKDKDGTASLSGTVGYTRALTDYLIRRAGESEVVRAQKASPDVNVLNGVTFEPADDSVKIADTKVYLSNLGISEKAAMFKTILQSSPDPSVSAQLTAMSETQLAGLLDQYLAGTPDDSTLLAIYRSSITAGSFDDNLAAFGAVSEDSPSSISIYADSFEDKDSITQCIDHYNAAASEEDKITYTDYVALITSSVTNIVNVITYVLIAFVAVSLVVSSIMIGIITYISVLERTKEIGILRAIGASKRNVSQVFNAETFIIGLLAGAIGVGVSLLLILPVNAVIHMLTKITTVNAFLPPADAAVLIGLSVLLTLIGGLIPSRKAARRDPVVALRTE